jgi:hypothetical protein
MKADDVLYEKLKKSASGISYLGTEDTPEAWSGCKEEHGCILDLSGSTTGLVRCYSPALILLSAILITCVADVWHLGLIIWYPLYTQCFTQEGLFTLIWSFQVIGGSSRSNGFLFVSYYFSEKPIHPLLSRHTQGFPYLCCSVHSFHHFTNRQ